MKKLLKVRISAVMLVGALAFGLLLAPATVLAAIPTIANAIPNQNASKSVAFNFQFANNTFNDADIGDSLSYTAQLNGGGALPAWLNFDGVTRTFSGTPNSGAVGTISIDVTADDGNGGSVTDTFDIVVADVASSTCSTYGMGEDAGVCQINDCEQLFAWAASPDAASMTRSYRVTQTLTCPGDMQTTPIGSDTLVFTGTFDGGGNTIQYINIDAAGGWNAGLFSNAYGATFKDLTIFFTNINPHGYSGALVGVAAEGTTIKNVRASNVYISSTGGVGGLVGQLIESTISYSSVIDSQLEGNGQEHGGLVGAVVGAGSLAVSKSYVSNTSVGGGDLVGGLIGSLDGAEISNVYAQASLTVPNGVKSGGLVGFAADGAIRNAYSAGSILGANSNSTGGLVGDLASGVTIQNSFAAVTGYSVFAFYGTSDMDPPVLINNYYLHGIANNQVCFSGTDGSEPNCTYDDNGHYAGNWLTRTSQPVANWDTFETWNLFPDSGSYPTLLGEGQITPAPFDGGNGTTNPYLISDCRQLQHMRDNLNANYRLSTNVDCAETVDWFGGKGFDPIGSNTGPYYGNFDGNGKTISNLYINRTNDLPGQQDVDESFVGLFGYIQGGSAHDVSLTNAKVRGYLYVGGIVGLLDDGVVERANFNVDVVTNDCLSGGHCVWARYGQFGGGLVGNSVNGSYIADSSTGGPVKGSGNTIGGIVGWAESGTLIENVDSSSSTDGGTDIGGIAGRLDSSEVINAHATGDVLVQTDDIKAGDSGGGLVGASVDSTISDSSASGDVNGRYNLGGLVGYADNSEIANSSSNGEVVSGYGSIGGFAGLVANSGISDSDSAVGNVTGSDSSIGGFAGAAICNNTFENATTVTDVSGWQSTGGFAGSDGCQGPAGTYSHVQATGAVDGYASTGGLIGFTALSIIDESSATGDVTGVFDTGGLIGSVIGNGRDDNESPMLITKSFATGNVTGISSYTGGLVGNLDGGVVSNSYARGNVHDDDTAGGLVGYASSTSAIQYSYTTGPITSDIMAPQGIVGTWGVGLLVTESFWDATVNPGLDESSGFGQGLTTADLKDQAVLQDANWSFDDIWGFNPEFNDGYACLQWSDIDCTVQANNADSDNDGILDVIENAGPNNGDANNDATPDASQANVTGFVNATTGKYTLIQTSCTTNFNVQSGRESAEHKDVGYDYPAELQSFVGIGCGAPGSKVDVVLYFYGDYDPTKFVLRKSADNTYATISGTTLTKTTIGGQSLLTAAYQVEDGGLLDQDHLADSNIVDPVGLAQGVVGVPNTGIK